MANGWGGKRVGAGRIRGDLLSAPAAAAKRAAATQRRREIIDQAVMANVTPLEVMTRTMMALWNDATRGATLDVGTAMQACGLARDVAPYLHPKLAMTAVRAEVRTETTVSPDEAQAMEDLALAAAFGAEGTSWPLLSHERPPSPTETGARVVGVSPSDLVITKSVDDISGEAVDVDDAAD
jgi:hypothetical protein